MSVNAKVFNNVRENVRASSSPSLSSPPTPSSPTHAKSTQQSPFQANPSLLLPNNIPNHAISGGEADGAKNTPVSVKKPRKKRDPANTGKKQSEGKNSTTAATDGKDTAVKQRKPRTSGTSTRGRKSKANPTTHLDVAQGTFPDQSKITDALAPAQPPANVYAPTAPPPSRNGNIEAIPTSPKSSFSPQKIVPRLSGQNYDPIRSSTIEARSMPPNPANMKPHSSPPSRPANYGSASNSPSISSLIDPPGHIHYPQIKRNSEVNDPSSPKRIRLTPPEQPLQMQHVPEIIHQPTVLPSNAPPVVAASHEPTPMELDKTEQATTKPAPVIRKSNNSTGTSTPGNTTKARQKEAPVAISSGNGLLSSAMLGGANDTSATEKTVPTIVLDVPLNGETNKYINFARLAEERYGFNALHPRLAAQRERLAKVAAAGAALENAEKRGIGSGMSGDDMSVDGSDGEGVGDDSNAETGGIGLIEPDVLGGKSPGEGSEAPVVKRKKRVMKEDQYDTKDPFVDDAELAWEEQAAASKDGFSCIVGRWCRRGRSRMLRGTLLLTLLSLLYEDSVC